MNRPGTTPDERTLVAIGALLAAALAMGASPLFVRLSEVGPFASAFWRVALALPVLAAWAWIETPPVSATGRAEPDPVADRALIWAGLLFAGDLTFWHLAIMNTSVANATFLATLAPVWVVLGSGFILNEAVDRRMIVGLALCLTGAAALIGETLNLDPAKLVGDIYGFITSIFFGAYFLAVRRARRSHGSGRILFVSSVITAIILFAMALAVEPQLWPRSGGAIVSLFCLALISHAGGQGMLAYALGHVPAAFSSLVIFFEAIAAAILGWIVLSEPISLLQAVGALAIMVGIHRARPRPIKPGMAGDSPSG